MNALDRLIPAPKKARLTGGSAYLGKNPPIFITAGAGAGAERVALLLAGELLGQFGLSASIDVSHADVRQGIILSLDAAVANEAGDSPARNEAYRLECRGNLVHLAGASEAGLRNAVWSLLAIAVRTGSGLAVPRCEIIDWPSLLTRWFMEDLSRGKVPTLDSLKKMARLLAGWKYNGFQLYVEHTFRYKKHPRIGGGWSPLLPAEVRELDDYCRRLGVELVPSLASFGHMERIFEVKKYRRLATGKPWRLLMPGLEASYRFLDELYSEYLPCFTSGNFNVNCDETFDLGSERSAPLVKKYGLGRVYLRHILRLYGLATKKYRKRMMMWGDIIGHHPELIPGLPRDVVVQPWGYFNTWRPRDMRKFVKSGLDFMVCSGTSAWHSPSPWTNVAFRNVQSAAKTSRDAGGLGTMVTDWGDGGHQQPFGLSMHGIANGAEQAWSGGAVQRGAMDARFSSAVFGDSRGDSASPRAGETSPLRGGAARLWRLLGTANDDLGIKPVYVFWWYTVNFGLLFYENDLNGKLFRRVKPAGVDRLRRTVERAGAILDSLDAKKSGPGLVRRELGYSIGLLRHLVDRLDWMLALKNGVKGPAIRRRGLVLERGLAGLRAEFLALWNARNRPRRREITLKLFDKAAAFYRAQRGRA